MNRPLSATTLRRRSRLPLAIALAVFVALLFAHIAPAGMLVKMNTKMMLPSGETVSVSEMMVEGENLRMKITGGDGDGEVIFRGDRQEMWILDHDGKRVMVLDKDGLVAMTQQISAAMKQLEAAMANVPEAQREAMEKMMKQQLGGALGDDAPPRKVTSKGRAEFGGRGCELLHVTRGDEKVAEVCTVPFGDVKGGADVARAFEGMTGFAQSLVEAVESSPMGSQLGALTMEDANPFALGTEYEGFPIMSRQFDDGELESESVLESMTSKSFPAGTFEPPDGYEMQTLGDMMAGMR